MKLALWNIERACAARPTKLVAVQARVASLAADICFLTEASTAISHPDLPEHHGSLEMPAYDTETRWRGEPIPYHPGEMRTRILTRYPIKTRHPVTDPLTNGCADIETPAGSIRVLATIIGVVHTRSVWERDLAHLRNDLERLCTPHLIVAGDLNVPLPGGLYKERREKLLRLLADFELTPVASDPGGGIDHFVVGRGIRNAASLKALVHPVERRISDHPIITLDMPEVANAE